jgi:NAD+ synthetase
MIGYSTKFGDSAGDFSPLGWLTVREVLEIGDDLGLPYDLVHKVPADGMSGRTDEEKIGFTYNELDDFLIKGLRGPNFDKIQKMIVASRHKRSDMSRFVSKHMEEDDK